MNKPLRILHLEDDRDFFDLVRSLLEAEGLPADFVLATTRAEFETAVTKNGYDLILADYMLPDYNGLQALRLAQRQCPETPFLLVSGTIGEQAAIEGLKAGATDYVLKQWPERLVPAIRRAAQEASDRTERRRAVTELARQEKYFRMLTENALDILTILDCEGNFLYNSPSLERVLGYPPKHLAGQSAFAHVHPEDLPQVQQKFAEALQHPSQPITAVFQFQHRDGSWRCLEAVGQNRLDDPEISAIVINSRDITERKRLEEQLRQAQKMEAIGQLAGGVAHDFNNILTVIHGHASLLLSGGNLAEPELRSAQQVIQAAERAAALTRQLLAFSRRQVMQPRCLDMNEVVGNLTKMLGRILGEDIALQLNYCPEPALVHADASMLEQVLLNLVVNARDAMPKGGLLTVRVSMLDVRPQGLAPHPEAPATRCVCLSVLDTGIGIPPENLRRIFEPFFTTKETGKGTGLGLATAYGIVKQHQGWIEVDSELGKGTLFKVFLPYDESGIIANPEPDLPPMVRGGAETILVVEDEAPVRDLVSQLLTSYGYKVLQAETGVRALEVWKDNHQRIDLVLTDLVMPDRLNGRELAERLWAERPQLKVIFTSGYSAEVVGKDFVLRRGLHYLQKPYHPHKLAAVVRECLDGKN